MDGTDFHGLIEEPSAKAQEIAMKAAEGIKEIFSKDEIAQDPTAEQGMTEEPSAQAQEDMLE